MEKKKYLWILAILLMIGISSAQSATQTVTVTVISGLVDITSPIEKVYQEHNLPVSVKIVTPLEIESVRILDNGEIKDSCFKCRTIEKSIYFKNGKHDLEVNAKLNSGEVISGKVSFEVDYGADIYILSGNKLKKATAKDISVYLFNYNFTISHKNDLAPEDSCSVRATGGKTLMNGENYGSNNKLNFYSVSSLEQGQVELTVQKGRKFLSYKLRVRETIENSEEFLKLRVEDKKGGEMGILLYDKINGKVDVLLGNMEISQMQVNFVKGCAERKTSFYLIEKKGNYRRSIEEIRHILKDNPIFLNRFDSLKSLFSEFWWLQRIF